MKKIFIFIIVILICSSTTAFASVDSDVAKLKYPECIKRLEAAERVFDLGPRHFSPDRLPYKDWTYEKELLSFEKVKANLAKTKTECNLLLSVINGSEISRPTTQTVKPVVQVEEEIPDPENSIAYQNAAHDMAVDKKLVELQKEVDDTQTGFVVFSSLVSLLFIAILFALVLKKNSLK